MTATARNFPVILVGFFFGGVARSVMIAVSSVFLYDPYSVTDSELHSNAYVVQTGRYIKLGQLHGTYGQFSTSVS